MTIFKGDVHTQSHTANREWLCSQCHLAGRWRPPLPTSRGESTTLQPFLYNDNFKERFMFFALKGNIFFKKALSFFILFFFIFSFSPSAARGETEDVLHLLKEKGIITESDIQKLKKSRKKRLKGGYKNGFKWNTGDQENHIKIGGRVHVDGQAFENDHTKNSSILVKRARIFTAGKLFEFYTWKVQAEFGSGSVSAKDLWVNMNYDKRFQLKLGQYKEPFSLEQNVSTKYLDFIERSTIGTRLTPDRDIGFMLHGLLDEDKIGYQLGIFNGNGSNQSADTDNDKDVAMRLWFEPVNDLHVGGSFTWGKQSKGLTDYSVPGSGTLFLDFDPAVVNSGKMELMRYGVELVYGIGPFRLTSEYMRADYDNVTLVATSAMDDFYVQGAYANLSWFFTGEEKRAKKGKIGRIKPKQNFNPKTGGWGAWELVGGYEWVEADTDWFSRGYATGSPGMDSYRTGINWYLNSMVRFMLDYVYSDYDRPVVNQDAGSTAGHEHMAWIRFALEF